VETGYTKSLKHIQTTQQNLAGTWLVIARKDEAMSALEAKPEFLIALSETSAVEDSIVNSV
jgi:hypothetical protein